MVNGPGHSSSKSLHHLVMSHMKGFVDWQLYFFVSNLMDIFPLIQRQAQEAFLQCAMSIDDWNTRATFLELLHYPDTKRHPHVLSGRIHRMMEATIAKWRLLLALQRYVSNFLFNYKQILTDYHARYRLYR